MSKDSLDFEKQWGKSAHVDLHDCDHERLISAQVLEDFVKQLIDRIGMVANGPCYIVRDGDPKENLEGYSAIQFIKTSSISVHLDEVGNRAYIDIFSCKNFEEQGAFDFSKRYFNAKEGKLTVLDR